MIGKVNTRKFYMQAWLALLMISRCANEFIVKITVHLTGLMLIRIR